LLVLACCGCGNGAKIEEKGIVFRAQCAASEPGALAVTVQGQPAWFGQARSFEVKFALTTTDEQGHPAITFHLAEKEILPFEAFTSVSVEGPLGIFLDGELIAAPAVQSVKGGSFTFCNEADGWTAQDRDRWLQRIQDSLGK
jgi:preprotein translocase subunit SecD